MATISISGDLNAARNKLRPMRPKPLIATFAAVMRLLREKVKE
jgi:hypothetical protein